MTDDPAILLIDPHAGDRALSTLLLQRELPRARIAAVPGALALAEALAGSPPDAVVIACDAGWADPMEITAVVKRRVPGAAVVVFGHEADLMAHLGSGLACDGVVPKTTAGFLALGGIVTEAVGRRARVTSAPAAPRQPSPAPPASAGPAPTPTPGSDPPPAPGLRPAPDLQPRGDVDLREIALVFSHDLREPVQQIERLARLGQKAGQGTGTSGVLEHVLRSSERVSRMLDDMVEYLSLTSRTLTRDDVDLEACLQQALGNLRTVIEETGVQVHAARLPMSVGDRSQLEHMFQNLLSNAVKFRGTRQPVVTITCEARDDQWLIGFRDDGIGIPRESTERIFELGRRLHTREEYPGNGIGLALCRRIVERHGGRIWAESGDGGGSTFYVLLPRGRGDGLAVGADAGAAAPHEGANW